MENVEKKSKQVSPGVVIGVLIAVLVIVVVAIVGAYYAKDNEAIATFDGGKVTKSEYKVYYLMFSSYLSYYGYSSDEIPLEIAYKAAADKMMLVDATAAGVTISDEDKAEVDEIFADETYISYFESYGFDIDDLRQIYYNDYIIEDYLEKLADEAADEDVLAYITSTYGDDADLYEYETAHILFSFTDDDGNTLSDDEKASLKVEAEAVLARALAGEDFATLAQEYSDDSTAEDGGVYVMYMDGNTVDEYADVVATMSEGEVYAALVESSYGYHIIKLNAKTENGRANNSTEREEYANSLYDNADVDKNLVIDEDVLKEFVLEIDPTAYDTDDETEEAA